MAPTAKVRENINFRHVFLGTNLLKNEAEM